MTSATNRGAPSDSVPCNDRCPRCGGTFHCGIADTGPCACTTVTLPPMVLADLHSRYTGCLCVRCLSELAAEAGLTA